MRQRGAEQTTGPTRTGACAFARTDAPLGKGIVAVETADHPSDAEVLSYARRHFKALDRMYKPDIGGSGTITSA